jgi:GNAT superfamily N-acetyltransferase
MSFDGTNVPTSAHTALQVRRFEQVDAEEVWELHRVTIAATGADAGAEFYADLRNIGGEYFDKGGDFLVGFCEHALVACGGYVPLSEVEIEIRRMRVHPDHQRRGFGAALLSALEQGAAKKGFQSVYLETTVVQQPALALYGKHGYEGIGQGRKQGYTILRLRKTLPL